jgi:hypothetical protein
MQTIWLQRSSPDIPWGFRLVGGREFGVPLSVQRVTSGSVAASALGPGDVILKVGNVMATNLEHNDAQDLVRQATNILQLTIKKSAEPSRSDSQPATGPGYGNYMSAQLNDNAGYDTTPRNFGTGIPLSPNYNESVNYATTPRNYGSQHQQPVTGTRIEIQRVVPVHQQAQQQAQQHAQQHAHKQSGYNNNYYYNDDNVDTGGSNFPDYTIAYRKQEPIHDSPGGPVNIRVHNPPSDHTSYSSKSLPRDAGVYSSSEREVFGTATGPPAYEPRSHNSSQVPYARAPAEPRFNTGLPLQQNSHQIVDEPTQQSYPNSYHSAPSQPAYGYGPLSPTSSAPKSQRNDAGSTPGFRERDPATPPSGQFSQAPFYGRDNNAYEQSNRRESAGNSYPAQAYSKPAYTPNNDDINVYNSAPQYHSAPKVHEPSHIGSSRPIESSSAFSPTQSKPYQSFICPGNSYHAPAATNRRVSFDQSVQDNEHYPHPSSFTTHKSPPPSSYPHQVHPEYEVHDSGISSSSSGKLSRQSSRHDDPYSAPPYTPQGGPLSPRSQSIGYSYSALPYTPQGGPLSPRSQSTGYGYSGDAVGYDPSGVSAAMEKVHFSPRFEPSPPVAPAPPPPPPPPPPPGPPPPPAPPLSDWNSTPYKPQNYKQRDEPEEHKIPDQILSTMLKSAKGGGPKPFSYGIDLSELKKKIGPPTAPKPRPGQPDYQEDDDEPEVPRHYGGPPRKPAGYVQSDYFRSRDDDTDPGHRANRRPAGQMQGDYHQSRQTGPRSEVDESPININMGTDPKKQSKSFKVLQWMTETDKDEPEESGQKLKRPKDPQRRHNADDDEMRFSGLHSKADIPSKAFGILQRIASSDSGTQNGRDTLDSAPTGVARDEEEDDDLPDTLNSDDMVDRRYKGGSIPSKVFKVLQQSVGEDTTEAPSPAISRPSPGRQPVTKSAAPVSDF